MSASAERKAERKAAAAVWQKDCSGSNPRTNAFTFRDDDQDKIIPQHGRRGKGRISPSDKPVRYAIKTSSAFSARLARGASVTPFWKRAEEIVGRDATDNPTAQPVVLDTNVVVSGLFTSQDDNRVSKRLMALALDADEVAPLVTWPIIGEYQSIFFKYGDYSLNRLCYLLSRSRLIPSLPAVEVPEVNEDPADTPFIEALVQSMRGLTVDQRPPSELVTWDRHLLKMTAAEDLPELLRNRIVTPIEILWQLRRK